MKNKIEKSEKNICFSREKFSESQNDKQNFATSGKTRMKTIGLRIRAVKLQYSSGDVMRNPYRQAV